MKKFIVLTIIFTSILIFSLIAIDGKKSYSAYVLTVNGERFHIPKGYIWAYDRVKNGEVQGAIYMHFIQRLSRKVKKYRDIQNKRLV